MADVHFTPAILAVDDTASQSAANHTLSGTLKAALFLPVDETDADIEYGWITGSSLDFAIVNHFVDLGLDIASQTLDTDDKGIIARYEVTTTAGKIDICMRENGRIWITLEGTRAALDQAGVSAALPVHPKRVTSSPAEFLGRERHSYSSATKVRTLVTYNLEEDERKELIAFARKRQALAKARANADAALHSLPATAGAFRRSLVRNLKFMFETASRMAAEASGGYSIDIDDLEDFRLALGDALSSLDDVSVRFDSRAREEAIMQIVDEQIEVALPKAA